jgi:membrane protein implicated in regulation of membrane protease activity
MTAVDILSLLSLALALTGNILVNKQKKHGFTAWIVANAGWVTVGLLSGQPNYFQIAMFTAYTVMNVIGFRQWTKIERSKQKED